MSRYRNPRRPPWFRGPLAVGVVIAVAAILAGIVVLPLLAGGEGEPAVSISLQPLEETPTPTPQPPPSPTPPQAPSPSPAPANRCDTVGLRLSALGTAVSEAMEGYDGTWGFALYDVDCESFAAFPVDYAQYPASAGKIVIAIAALRAVERGLVAFEDIEGHMELAMHLSLDAEIDAINSLLEPAQIAEVLELAGTGELTVYEHDWRQARMSPIDLARVWAALLRGDLLSPRWTSYVLALAAGAVFPEGYDTFPEDLGIEGYEYGQKAGYWVSGEEPDVLVGAGYIRPTDGSSKGFALVLMTVTSMDDVFDEQRRSVFPLLLEFVLGEIGQLEVPPPSPTAPPE